MIVEVFLNYFELVNRTNFDCIENGLFFVCMDLKFCFLYKGKEVLGYIGKGVFIELIFDRMCILFVNFMIIFRVFIVLL